jgi:hypothetical protein
VKGEIYDPVYVIPPATVTTHPNVLLFNQNEKQSKNVQLQLHPNKDLNGDLKIGFSGENVNEIAEKNSHLVKGVTKNYDFKIEHYQPKEVNRIFPYANQKIDNDTIGYFLALRAINYDHIPAIKYFYSEQVKTIHINLKTAGKKIGYIIGSGDKVAEVLEELGYDITLLDQSNLATINLSNFDAIITGVRAYNTNEWLNNYYTKLMEYVKNGGNMIVQYNTSNNIGPVRAQIAPYDFTISRNRITNENAKVVILDTLHPVFNFPNKITDKDFEGWIQERSIYHATNWDAHFKPLISMTDPNEKSDEGSLIVCKYGKGFFTYTGLVFFRQLPASVPGAFRLIANLIALNQQTENKNTTPIKRK